MKELAIIFFTLATLIGLPLADAQDYEAKHFAREVAAHERINGVMTKCGAHILDNISPEAACFELNANPTLSRTLLESVVQNVANVDWWSAWERVNDDITYRLVTTSWEQHYGIMVWELSRFESLIVVYDVEEVE